ncbi:XdhC family protein [Steroidobacter denitrificans]|nr:XdhC/CoxI family protein [Steroidobacter denitrificans]
MQSRDRGEPLVLATIVQTSGSTYRKAGAHMLIGPEGRAAGLLSGGCLETDLFERAQRVLESRTAELVTYDTRSSDDLIWGLGLGCEGATTILLTPLHLDSGYRPFATIEAARVARMRTAFAVVIRAAPQLPLGQWFQMSSDGRALQALEGEAEIIVEDPVEYANRQTLPIARSNTWEVHAGGALLRVIPVPLSLRILILGAGPDVLPLVQIADLLGWEVTIVDHRPAYAVADRFPNASVVLSPALDMASAVDPNAYDAAVVMSHHLISDIAYLRALARSSTAYIGVLGPVARRERLLNELGAEAAMLVGRLHGPIGLDIGANTPESIALAIAGEIHAMLSGASGRSLGRSL